MFIVGHGIKNGSFVNIFIANATNDFFFFQCKLKVYTSVIHILPNNLCCGSNAIILFTVIQTKKTTKNNTKPN